MDRRGKSVMHPKGDRAELNEKDMGGNDPCVGSAGEKRGVHAAGSDADFLRVAGCVPGGAQCVFLVYGQTQAARTMVEDTQP